MGYQNGRGQLERPSSLLGVLQVLLGHHEQIEKERDAECVRGKSDFYAKVGALEPVMKDLADGKRIKKLPDELADLLTLKVVVAAVKKHVDAVAAVPGAVHRWYDEAQFVLAPVMPPLAPEQPPTPWEDGITFLISKCQVPDIAVEEDFGPPERVYDDFFRRWTHKEGMFGSSDPRTAEMVRLEEAGVHLRMLAMLRERFPKEIDEWFPPEKEASFVDTTIKNGAPHLLAVTVYYHGDQSYSIDGNRPVNVPKEQHNIFQGFLGGNNALETRQLENKGVTNVSKTMGNIESRFPGAVRFPQKKHDGYYIRVRNLTTPTS